MLRIYNALSDELFHATACTAAGGIGCAPMGVACDSATAGMSILPPGVSSAEPSTLLFRCGVDVSDSSFATEASSSATMSSSGTGAGETAPAATPGFPTNEAPGVLTGTPNTGVAATGVPSTAPSLECRTPGVTGAAGGRGGLPAGTAVLPDVPGAAGWPSSGTILAIIFSKESPIFSGEGFT